MKDKLSVVVFSGGRGTATICDALKRHPQISLTVLVNTYDDGKSTGALRRFVPGMLGPSDIRKNIAQLMPDQDRSDLALRKIIEHRLPEDISFETGMTILEALAAGQPPTADAVLNGAFAELRVGQLRSVSRYARAVLDYLRLQLAQRNAFPMGDCAVGNLLFTGSYLLQGQDFNRAVDDFRCFCEAEPDILNVTDGKNAVLVGLKEDGEFLADEASIVSFQSPCPITDIFLLDRYLTAGERKQLSARPVGEAAALLAQREMFPAINPAAAKALREADVIIYGPGTQHSSLFPSYITEGLGALIAGNKSADKVFVSNLLTDHEIQGETANSLFCKLAHYLNSKGRTAFTCKELVTVSFLQTAEASDAGTISYVECDPTNYPFTQGRVILGNWQDGQGRHFGGRVLDELVRIVNSRVQKKLRSFSYMVSIIVPGLNEQRTVRQVLHELTLLNLEELGISKEIIYVDGGSTDRSVELARSVRGVRVYEHPGAKGRGAALRFGAQKATGNIIAFFPSDAEYGLRGLVEAVEMVSRSEYPIVFGSRLIKCLDLSDVIRGIYGRNYLSYLLSKYGGMLMSLTTQLLYNRYVMDVFTGVKVFDAEVFRRLKLVGNGVDLEAEIVAKAAINRVFILEIPVDYYPRTRQQGKKMTVLDGLAALVTLVRYVMASPKSFLGRRRERHATAATRPETTYAPSSDTIESSRDIISSGRWPLVSGSDEEGQSDPQSQPATHKAA